MYFLFLFVGKIDECWDLEDGADMPSLVCLEGKK
jgi:hypothetical protein